MPLAVTAIHAGLNAALLIWLTFQVIGQRRRAQVSINTGGDETLAKTMRAHGNAAEFIPIFLILMAVTESLGLPWYVLHPIGFAFLAGRVLHARHFVKGTDGRVRGMQLTIIALGVLGVLAVLLGLWRQFAG